MQEPENETVNNGINLRNTLEAIKSLENEQEITDFVSKRLTYLETNSTKKEISILNNDRMNGSITNGYINSESPITTSFLVDPFYLNDKTLYIEFIKSIYKNELKNPIQLIHELQDFTIEAFGFRGDQKTRESIYLNHQDSANKISIADFYKNNSAMCIERSASVQNLASFMGVDSYLIFGSINSTDDAKKSSHAYNIFKMKDGTLVLFDSTNTIALTSENKPVFVPAYHVFEKGITIEDLEEINFDSEKLAKNYNLELHPDEPNRTYYTPAYKDRS